MRVAVVGATGMVGRVMLQILEERNFPVTELMAVASKNSIGNKVVFKGQDIKIISMEDAIAKKPDIALFSAGGDTSKAFAPKFAEAGTVVIDNSSAWRMETNVPLVVPEVNASVITKDDTIIANPNCSTIQMVVVLQALHQKYTIKRVVISTYQSVTGTGKAAVQQLEEEIVGKENMVGVYPHPIFKNALPHCDVFEEENYTKEELKLVRETQKILNDSSVQLTATCVRVPVQGGHSESVNIEFKNDFELEEVKQLLANTEGVTVVDNPEKNEYPMPLYSEGKDDIFVGRIRRDFSQPKSLNLFIVSDNLRKGAATNAVQIAEKVLKL